MDRHCKNNLNNCRLTGLWLKQSLPCYIEVFKRAVKIRLKDQFIKNGIKLYHNAVYRIIKTSFCFESYLNELPDLLRKYFTKLTHRGWCTVICVYANFVKQI